MAYQEHDFYQKLRSKIRDWLKTKKGQSSKWLEYLMFAPGLFHLLCRLSIDKDDAFVKSHQTDGKVKSSKCKACES